MMIEKIVVMRLNDGARNSKAGVMAGNASDGSSRENRGGSRSRRKCRGVGRGRVEYNYIESILM
jgi:hypothetical protein